MEIEVHKQDCDCDFCRASMKEMKTWSDHHRAAIAAGMDDASACHQADEAMATEKS